MFEAEYQPKQWQRNVVVNKVHFNSMKFRVLRKMKHIHKTVKKAHFTIGVFSSAISLFCIAICLEKVILPLVAY
jgi:hypothetical protein